MLTAKLIDRKTSKHILGMNVDSLAQLKKRIVKKEPSKAELFLKNLNPFLLWLKE
jgi:hypothetical protein